MRICIYSGGAYGMTGSIDDSWRANVENIVRRCTADVYKIDWEGVVQGLNTSTMSIAEFSERFGRGIRIFLEFHGLDCVDPGNFLPGVYADMCEAVQAGLLEDPARLPELLRDVLSARAEAEVERAFWSLAAHTEVG